MLLAFAGVTLGAIPSATVPPSAYEGGLINTPNPIDRSSDLPITGNVAGGRQFRGSIPYDATTSFRAPLGSTSLDSFLRYSTVPQGQNGYPYNYSPFYSPSGSVSTTLPGYSGVFSPSSPRIAGGLPQYRTNQMVDSLPMVEVPQPQIPMGERSAAVDPGIGVSPRLRYWPMSPSADEMRSIVSDELGDQLATQPPDPTMTPEEYQRQLEQLRRDLERVRANASQLGQNLNAESATVPPQSPLQQPLPQPPVIQPGEAPADGLQTIPPADPLPDPSAGQTRSDAAEPGRLAASQRIEEIARAFDATSKILNRPGGEPAGGAAAAAERANRLRGASEIADDPRDSAEPNRIRPTQESSGSITQLQFDHYLAAAELYMQQGRYYRAADSFTLASVYIPHDPRTHLGKSHALLAAGEYVSSAVSLARALELDAPYVLRKVNLVEAIGGPDVFVQRVTNLEEIAKGSDAPQLQLLLAYIYFQMDRPDEAKSAIEAARKGLPSSVAANLLEVAIQGNPK